MEEVFQKIKNTPDRELNRDLTKEIRSKIFILKFRTFLFSSFFLLVVILLFFSVQVYFRMLESEAPTVIKVFIQDLDFDADYLINFVSGLNEVLPKMEIIVLVINLSLLVCLTKITYHYRRQLFKAY